MKHFASVREGGTRPRATRPSNPNPNFSENRPVPRYRRTPRGRRGWGRTSASCQTAAREAAPLFWRPGGLRARKHDPDMNMAPSGGGPSDIDHSRRVRNSVGINPCIPCQTHGVSHSATSSTVDVTPSHPHSGGRGGEGGGRPWMEPQVGVPFRALPVAVVVVRVCRRLRHPRQVDPRGGGSLRVGLGKDHKDTNRSLPPPWCRAKRGCESGRV